jgi:hypothetical protein
MTDIVDHHIGAMFGETNGNGPADSSGTTGDQGDLLLERKHRRIVPLIVKIDYLFFLYENHVAQTNRPWFRLPAYGLIVSPERPADRPSLAWPPVADILSATLRALFSGLPGLPAMQPPPRPISLPTSVVR